MTKPLEHGDLAFSLVLELFRVSASEATTLIDYHTRIDLLRATIAEWIEQEKEKGQRAEEKHKEAREAEKKNGRGKPAAGGKSKKKTNGKPKNARFSKYTEAARLLGLAPSRVNELVHDASVAATRSAVAAGFPYTLTLVLQALEGPRTIPQIQDAAREHSMAQRNARAAQCSESIEDDGSDPLFKTWSTTKPRGAPRRARRRLDCVAGARREHGAELILKNGAPARFATSFDRSALTCSERIWCHASSRAASFPSLSTSRSLRARIP